MQALTQRKVDLAFRVYQAMLGGAADGDDAQPMDTDTQVGPLGGQDGGGQGGGRGSSLYQAHLHAASDTSKREMKCRCGLAVCEAVCMLS